MVDEFLAFLEKEELTFNHIQIFKQGNVLLSENEPVNKLYLIVEGDVSLMKRIAINEEEMAISSLEKGDIVGILGFLTGLSAISTAVVTSPEAKLLQMYTPVFEGLVKGNPIVDSYFTNLILNSLLRRYQKNIDLSVDVTISQIELESIQKKLITQEKMATLGQLVAGLAHELNNPASALVNAAQFLNAEAKNLFRQETYREVFLAGLSGAEDNTRLVRQRMEELGDMPGMSRAYIRQICSFPEKLFSSIVEKWKEGSITVYRLQQLVDVFQSATAIQSVGVSAHRIAELVSSLKRYSRTENASKRDYVPANGIRDSLLILKHKSKGREVETNFLNDVSIHANAGELNQVWTNLLSNALEAVGDGGKIVITQTSSSEGTTITIEDNGPGVPESLRKQIFQLNFTTKHTDGSFGLGLGLSISKEIVETHGGIIRVEESERLKGACFVVFLPYTEQNESNRPST